jgi:hypothetical protein
MLKKLTLFVAITALVMALIFTIMTMYVYREYSYAKKNSMHISARVVNAYERIGGADQAPGRAGSYAYIVEVTFKDPSTKDVIKKEFAYTAKQDSLHKGAILAILYNPVTQYALPANLLEEPIDAVKIPYIITLAFFVLSGVFFLVYWRFF